MPSAHDVVAFIRRERGPVGGYKLQKLLYYIQAWSLVWDDEPAFADPIEAWLDGPVVPAVWGAEKRGGREGNPDALSAKQRETALEVLRVYARHKGDWLSALSHRERPWLEARGTTPGGAPSSNVISHESMRSFYGQACVDAKSFSGAYERGLRVLVALPEHEADRLFDHARSTSGADVVAWLERGGVSPWPASSD